MHASCKEATNIGNKREYVALGHLWNIEKKKKRGKLALWGVAAASGQKGEAESFGQRLVR